LRDDIINDYFNWLFDLVCGKRFSNRISYKKLLTRLHSIEFTYILPNDQNRAEDGINLRYRYAITNGYEDSYQMILDYLDGPCSVLEMMVALAVYCEENIMDDPSVGNRTDQWFWGMITNLGLGSMVDSKFDRRFVDDTIYRFLDREYEPDGTGGLFRVRHSDRDLRTVEIWYQLCWYLDTIV
jgi:hypothetical protein